MKFKNIQFIINPGSGKEEPILSYLHNALNGSDIDWDITVTRKEEDTFNTAKQLIGKTDLVVIYGGDGSVTKAAAALYGNKTPLAVIPGGTANILSKELGIPQDSPGAIELIVAGNAKVRQMDMGIANGTPFLLRINLGIMADMILDADAGLKSKLGQVAYGITALKTTIAAKPLSYELTIDGKQINEEGVSLTVTNAGNIGIGEMSFLPGISVYDGELDVILLKSADPLSMLQVAGSTLFHTTSDVLKHWRCKEVVIELSDKVKYICDDCEDEAKKIEISIIPKALNVLVPK
ncbi:diacylglycerol/lipid kinase family protein [Mucilaginibacter gilvus]|uniref:YegS/Rv2252/BmrU family lipid kinase n=1 Tax=Mucilaginibacter gilvus TaxID=2305909 RepID=A0A444MRB3_9SPHI|nr:YegS/Rv2252/BmrU family lipid kinase [Mucilaginibacter gilvus]RWY54133.1 YegS/Rv2252/BmrU family lipid kinase [Mucilaginibacter gilvus]